MRMRACAARFIAMCEVQLDFENQMFIELLAQDGMVVLARLAGVPG